MAQNSLARCQRLDTVSEVQVGAGPQFVGDVVFIGGISCDRDETELLVERSCGQVIRVDFETYWLAW